MCSFDQEKIEDFIDKYKYKNTELEIPVELQILSEYLILLDFDWEEWKKISARSEYNYHLFRNKVVNVLLIFLYINKFNETVDELKKKSSSDYSIIINLEYNNKIYTFRKKKAQASDTAPASASDTASDQASDQASDTAPASASAQNNIITVEYTIRGLGSLDPNSDYDVSLVLPIFSGKTPNIEEKKYLKNIIIMVYDAFNDYFLKIIKQASSKIFDTNLYIHPIHISFDTSTSASATHNEYLFLKTDTNLYIPNPYPHPHPHHVSEQDSYPIKRLSSFESTHSPVKTPSVNIVRERLLSNNRNESISDCPLDLNSTYLRELNNVNLHLFLMFNELDLLPDKLLTGVLKVNDNYSHLQELRKHFYKLCRLKCPEKRNQLIVLLQQKTQQIVKLLRAFTFDNLTEKLEENQLNKYGPGLTILKSLFDIRLSPIRENNTTDLSSTVTTITLQGRLKNSLSNMTDIDIDNFITILTQNGIFNQSELKQITEIYTKYESESKGKCDTDSKKKISCYGILCSNKGRGSFELSNQLEDVLNGTNKKSEDVFRKYISNLHKLLHFADETYYSLSAFIHVVELLQAKNDTLFKKLKKKSESFKSILKISIIDQFAFILHTIITYKAEADYIILKRKISKYLARLCNALDGYDNLERNIDIVTLDQFTLDQFTQFGDYESIINFKKGTQDTIIRNGANYKQLFDNFNNINDEETIKKFIIELYKEIRVIIDINDLCIII